MLKSTSAFVCDIFRLRKIIYQLAKRDFQQQYQGSILGFLWVFLQPLLFFSVLYVVFSLGFRTGTSGAVPFELYLISGMIGWMFFSETFSATTHVIKSFAFLVKKVDFRLSILPIVKIVSGLAAHLFLLLVAIALCWYRGYAPSLYALQVIYYLIAMIILLIGLGWLTSSTSLFVKDVGNVVAIIVQFGFWLTPIIWHIERVPAAYRWLAYLNPFYYIVTGYRDSLIYHIPFWERPQMALYFWSVTLVLLFLGMLVFRKLRPHFAEVI